jgi:hypothetical protein
MKTAAVNSLPFEVASGSCAATRRALRCSLALLALVIRIRLQAAPFDSGSTGAYGALDITTNTTLQLPADGVYHCTTINIRANATLQFTRNALNTPVYLLATGEILVAGTIDVSGGLPAGNLPGAGGPGGFDGGYGGYGVGATTKGGDGQGPGGGKNQFLMQHAVFATPVNLNSNIYGNTLLSPLIGGSGGAGSDGGPGGYGGGGGGAILLASNTRITVTGAIQANGGGGGPAGSGGGIRVVAPVVGGTGLLRGFSPYSGPSGRIRIDCEDKLAFRSLRTDGGSVTRGSQMFVFPTVVPRLDIVQAAGKTIPEGAGNAVEIELPVGSPTEQTVTVQGRNFTGVVPITVMITPETGPSATYVGELNMGSSNPAQTTIKVVIPVGSVSRVNAWAN